MSHWSFNKNHYMMYGQNNIKFRREISKRINTMNIYNTSYLRRMVLLSVITVIMTDTKHSAISLKIASIT